jgi:hypothetical protein
MINSLPFFWSRQQFDKAATLHTHRASELPFPKQILKIDHRRSRETSPASSGWWDVLHLWFYTRFAKPNRESHMHQSNNNFWKCMLEVAERDLYARAEREREREREEDTSTQPLGWLESCIDLWCIFDWENHATRGQPTHGGVGSFFWKYLRGSWVTRGLLQHIKEATEDIF